MTALVAIREGNLSDMVTVKREATLTEGSSMYLKEGEQLTLEALLYGLMLCSGNDAAVAIAERVGHKHISTTMNVYAHLFPNRQELLVEALEQMHDGRFHGFLQKEDTHAQN